MASLPGTASKVNGDRTSFVCAIVLHVTVTKSPSIAVLNDTNLIPFDVNQRNKLFGFHQYHDETLGVLCNQPIRQL